MNICMIFACTVFVDVVKSGKGNRMLIMDVTGICFLHKVCSCSYLDFSNFSVQIAVK